MSIENVITQAVNLCGYEHIRDYIYRARWSTRDVEHFLYFRRYGALKQYLTAEFGMRSSLSEGFGIECAKKYASTLRREYLEKIEKDQCTLVFDFGMMSGWTPRGSITLQDFTPRQKMELISNAIQNNLIPKIKDILSARKYEGILASDNEPFSWFRNDSIIRASQFAILANRVDFDSSYIRGILLKYISKISRDLDKEVNPYEFIERLIELSNEYPVG